jgi:hypothetical protein
MKTYGRVAVNKENRFKMVLEPPDMFNKVKNTNVIRISKTYLKIHGHGIFKTVIYGNNPSADIARFLHWSSGLGIDYSHCGISISTPLFDTGLE